MKPFLSIATAALFCYIMPLGAATRPFTIEEIEVAQPGSGPTMIASDSHGYIWVALAKVGKIARVSSNGSVCREYPLPDAAYPVGVAIDKDDNIWYTDIKNNRLTCYSPATNSYSHHEVPTKGAWPFGLRIASDGKLWFTERFACKFGCLDPVSGKFEEWEVQPFGAQPAGLTVTPSGHVFFTQNSGHKIGHYDLSKQSYAELTVPTEMKSEMHYGLSGIDHDSHGNIWFNVLDGKIGFVSSSSGYKDVTLVDFPVATARPGGMYVDGADHIWVTELDGNHITVYFPEEKRFERYPIPTGKPDEAPLAPPEAKSIADDTGRPAAPASGESNGKVEGRAPKGGSKPDEGHFARTTRPFGIVSDKTGRIWFTEQFANQIGCLTIYSKPAARVHSIEFTVDFDEWAKLSNDVSESLHVARGENIQWRIHGTSSKTELVIEDPTGIWYAKGTVGKGLTSAATRKGKYTVTIAAEGQKHVIAVEVRDGTIPSIVYDVHENARVPGVVDVAPNGDIWFTDIGGFGIPGLAALPPGSRVARLTPKGEAFSYETPTASSAPTSLKVSSNGEVWFTERLGNALACLDPKTYAIKEYPVLTADSAPTGIAIDKRRGWIWFTQKSASQIGYLDPKTGKVVEIPTPNKPSEPSTIAVAPDGFFWFDERSQGNIIRYNPETKAFLTYSLSSSEARSIGVTPYTDSAGWFLELAGNKIGHLNVKTSQITEYAIPTDHAYPFKLAVSPRAIWFTQVFGNKLGRFSPDGGFAEFRAPIADAFPGGIARTKTGDVWYTLQGAAAVVQVPAAWISAAEEF